MWLGVVRWESYSYPTSITERKREREGRNGKLLEYPQVTTSPHGRRKRNFRESEREWRAIWKKGSKNGGEEWRGGSREKAKKKMEKVSEKA